MHINFLNNNFNFISEMKPILDSELKSVKTDLDELLHYHKFIRSEQDNLDKSYGNQLAQKYYESLYKEYAICDLSYYKQGKIGMRWCTEKEILNGKGRISCANLKCNENTSLGAYETNFEYTEHGVKKNTLVKVILCTECGEKLKETYRHLKKKKNS